MISSPSHKACRCTGGSLLPRLIKVPLVDPRSSRKYCPFVRVIRACRRETLASGSSVSRSTSGKMPPSASHRPMWASTSLSMNCFPLDRPFSITNLACGLEDCFNELRFRPAETWPPANSGRWGEGACTPFCPSPLPYGFWPSSWRPFGLRGAPHSSQYCEPSKFSVLHRSQVIIGN